MRLFSKAERGCITPKEVNMSLVEITVKDKVAFIEMKNAKHLNCLSKEFCEDLCAALKSAYEGGNCAVVIKAEKGVKVWSAGHDIKELPLSGEDPLGYDVPMERLLRAVGDLPIPVIAFVEGGVWGGACDLCLSCDMIVAADTSTFAITPAKIGIPYNASGIMHFVNQLGVNKAREMFFTGGAIAASDALNVGLLNYIAPIDKLEGVLDEKILNPIRRNSIISISAIKRQFRQLSRTSSLMSAETYERIDHWRNIVYRSNDYKEGITSFLEKRPPVFNGNASDLDAKA